LKNYISPSDAHSVDNFMDRQLLVQIDRRYCARDDMRLDYHIEKAADIAYADPCACRYKQVRVQDDLTRRYLWPTRARI